MTVKISAGKAVGEIKAPPSKSMAHRYLICGALSSGSVISGISLSDDISATVDCLKCLGADITVSGDTANLGGLDFTKEEIPPLNCRESGSTLRFILPLCLLFDREITLTGTKRLFERSLSVYEQICLSQGMLFRKGESSVTVRGKLKSGSYSVRGDISSQFISGLMLALSLIEGDSVINIEGKIESASYLGLTVKALGDFGVRVSRTDERTLVIKGGQSFKRHNLKCEGDYSNAAFFEALTVLGGNVNVSGLDDGSAQGDRVYKELFKHLEREKCSIDISDCPDLAPVLMAVGAAKHGIRLTGTSRLKIKESDRGEAMRAELEKFGVRVTVKEYEIDVSGDGLKAPSVPIFGHNDHRIVMSSAVLLTLTGGEIIGAQAVSKSFPDFFERLSDLGVGVEVLNAAD